MLLVLNNEKMKTTIFFVIASLTAPGNICDGQMAFAIQESMTDVANYLERSQSFKEIRMDLMKAVDQAGLKSEPLLLGDYNLGNRTSAECAKDFGKYSADMLKGANYAFSMFDSTGKPSSGFMAGNVKMYGDYDQCLNVSTFIPKSVSFSTEYCVAIINIPGLIPPGTPPQYYPQLGICLPNSCSNDTARIIIETQLKKLANYVPMFKNIQVAAVACNTPAVIDGGVITSIVVTSILVILVVIGTTFDIIRRYRERLVENGNLGNRNCRQSYESLPEADNGTARKGLLSDDDHIVNEKEPILCQNFAGEFFMAFSFVKNAEKLFDTKASRGNIACLHGIRFFSMTWVILGHTYVFLVGFIGNVADLAGVLKRFTFRPIANGTFSVDTFFVLSGLLVGYLCLNQLKRNEGKLNWIMFYAHRFLRLTPSYAYVLMLVATIFLKAGNGPFYITLSMEPEALGHCKEYWWTNLVYINNFYPLNFSKQCMGWSWYLGNDMMFYIISPLFLIPLFKKRSVGIVLTLAAIISCTITTGVLSWWYNVPVTDTGGLPTNQTMSIAKGFDIIYGKPYTRISTYALGLLLGSLLHLTQCKKVFNWSKMMVILLWCLAASVALADVYGLYGNIQKGELPNNEVSALYNAVSRLAWALCVGWVIFACSHGFGGLVNKFLSWKIWIPVSRLTYCAYLVHPMLIYIYGMNLKTPIHYDDVTIILLYIGFLFSAYACALIVSLLIEAPMLALEKLLLKR